VFVFHGQGGSMQNAARMFACHRRWPQALAIYLQGLFTSGKWIDPEGNLPGWHKIKSPAFETPGYSQTFLRDDRRV
jgi:polyhydroxybutyrate depolymerase